MKKLALFMIIVGFLFVGNANATSWFRSRKSEAPARLWFANAPQNDTIKIKITDTNVRRAFCRQAFGIELGCVDAHKVLQEVDVHPGEIISIKHPDAANYIYFFEQKDGRWIEVETTKKNRARLSRTLAYKPLADEITKDADALYTIGPRIGNDYQTWFNKWGGSKEKWLVPTWPNQKDAGKRVIDVAIEK